MLSDQEFCQVIADTLEVPIHRVTWDADLLIDLNADSLSLAELTTVLEGHIGRPVPPDKLPDVLTVGDLHGLLRTLEK